MVYNLNDQQKIQDRYGQNHLKSKFIFYETEIKTNLRKSPFITKINSGVFEVE